MTQALIFDLDGTLVDSAPDLHAAANRMLKAHGREALSLKTVISFIGNGIPKLTERCLLATGDARDLTAAVDLFYDVYSANLSTLTRPYSGVVDMLDQAQAAGCSMAICTNKPIQVAQQLCDNLDLSKYFTAVIGGNSLAVRKPNPAPLLEAVRLLGADVGSSLFIGDSITDFRTAEAAKLRFAFFQGGYQPLPIKGIERHVSFADWSRFWSVISGGDRSGSKALS